MKKDMTQMIYDELKDEKKEFYALCEAIKNNLPESKKKNFKKGSVYAEVNENPDFYYSNGYVDLSSRHKYSETHKADIVKNMVKEYESELNLRRSRYREEDNYEKNERRKRERKIEKKFIQE